MLRPIDVTGRQGRPYAKCGRPLQQRRIRVMKTQHPKPSKRAPIAMTATPDQLFAYLDGLGIPHATISHPPLFTVEQSQALRGTIAGGHTKNLFLRDKKQAVFLVVAEEDAEIDLKGLHRRARRQRPVFLRLARSAARIARRDARLGHRLRRHQRHARPGYRRPRRRPDGTRASSTPTRWSTP